MALAYSNIQGWLQDKQLDFATAPNFLSGAEQLQLWEIRITDPLDKSYEGWIVWAALGAIDNYIPRVGMLGTRGLFFPAMGPTAPIQKFYTITGVPMLFQNRIW